MNFQQKNILYLNVSDLIRKIVARAKFSQNIYYSLKVRQQFILMSFNHEQQSHDFSEAPPQNNYQANYGNLKVLCKRPIHISIGPDYPFTIIAFIFLSVISCALYLFGNAFLVDDFWRNINFILVVTPVSSFLYTALSNPGVYSNTQNRDQRSKYCESCKIFTSKNVYHCHNCNICIQGYDHHCPWLSKCVGKKNLISFYVFAISTHLLFLDFWYLIYRAIVDKPSS